jgi:hypothetical protein
VVVARADRSRFGGRKPMRRAGKIAIPMRPLDKTTHTDISCVSRREGSDANESERAIPQ